jgi:tetratricopeptide (TPR) repeat protein
MAEMPTLDAIPVAEPVGSRYEVAAQLLEKAVQANSQDPQIAYLLALAYKRQGQTAEARTALRKIARPDANVLLQMGLLSLRENQLAQAEQEFARAWQMDDRSFAICHNLLLTRLSLGQTDAAQALLPQALELAPTREQKRFFTILGELMAHTKKYSAMEAGSLLVFDLDSPLESITQAEEQRLLKVIRSLGQVDASLALLRTLVNARPNSSAVQDAYVEAALVKARDLMDRCSWTEAQFLLAPLAREEKVSRASRVAINNLLGCCHYLTQDFERAVEHFTNAVRLVNTDPRLQQNLALAHERSDDVLQAENHWTRFLELLDSVSMPVPPDFPRYLSALEYEAVMRLANMFAGKEKWNSVLNYLQRAHRLRPEDHDVLERLFHVYNHAKQPHNARKMLERLRALRPNDPQLDLYEIDLVEVKNLSDIERMLTEIERILRRYPDDHRVEERAVNMVGNVIPLMGNLCDQLTEQLNKVVGQVGNLPRYQVDWSALHEIMRDLVKEFQKLRRITGKCMPLVSNDEHKRIVRELAEHIDQKIETCRSMGG